MTFAEFKADGKMSFTGDINGKAFEVPGTYKVDGNKLLLKIGDKEIVDEEVTILKLTADELATTAKNGKKLTFERVKAKKVEPVQVDAKMLVGKWKATDKEGKAANAFTEFKADGKMSVAADFNGKTTEVAGTYKVDGNKLIMEVGGGDREIVTTILKLTDDALVMTEKGKEQTFERVKAKKGDK